MAASCPNCQTLLQSGVRFCPECGAPVSPPHLPVLTAKATTRHGTAKRSFIPTAFVLLVIVGVAVVFFALGHDDGKGTLASQTSKAPGSDGSSSQDGYHPSDEIIDPYAISKNPYLLKGHSGILDTVHVFVQMGNERVPIGYPGGALTFNKLLDEHTATYQVRGGSNPQFPDAEIAVILPDSNPPDTRKMWRIFVEGTIDGINGLGAPLQIGAIRFEGYYDPSTAPLKSNATDRQVADNSASTTRIEDGSADGNGAFDNSKIYVNTAPASPFPPSNGTGDLLVSVPSKVPILTGHVKASDLHGFGAVVCPDSKAFAAFADIPAQNSGGESDQTTKKPNSDLDNFRRYGCSYFPPGMAMVSDGGDPGGSLVSVRVDMHDGKAITGVTFSNWIVQNEQQ